MNLQLVFMLIILVLSLYLIYRSIKKQKNKILLQIKKEWTKKSFSRKFEPLNSVKSYWNQQSKKNTFVIDDITWNDLSMDQLFTEINFTHTSPGAEKLYSLLRNIQFQNNNVKNEEEFIQLLKNDNTLRENIQLCLGQMGKKNYSETFRFFYSVNDKYMKHTYLYVFLSLLPILSSFLFLISSKLAIIIFVLCMMLNGFIYHIHKREYEYNFDALSYVTTLINCSKKLMKIEHPSFVTKRKIIKRNLRKLGNISLLGSFISSNSGNNSELIMDYIRIFFLIDFIAYNRILKKIENNRKEYSCLWHVVSDIDSFLAIAYFRHKYNNYCIPEFVEDMVFIAEDLYHPLVEKPVPNNITIRNNVLITGSNASGKSTFIKSVAINSILAQTMNTALATKLTLKPSNVLTSMAINDDIISGDSYFIAEIKSLKRIIDAINEGEACLTFIDEILRGTNTIERISASSSILKWIFYKKNNLSIVASHDIELTEIIDNFFDSYHFSESVNSNSIWFDYKIKSGPSYTKNAIKLLRNVNFPDDIVRTSADLAESFVQNRDWPTFKQLDIF
ncbi:DNA mismatch repair protein MutS [Gracilibacillus halophilus YIM-C55.5]|uniref:DNA mismatch repair protein MutS n=1 Tax=Gracilibacillus halophilus YIM-C55.5 TaxID=1308866 RepID=N4WSQ2_9BACI|nr:DNA mismatch repair protein MutS [Gracilibacillus halophilus]ENH96196.1 DNA mismatch repair protein MutS [Gracilibacillus halophilus YIM-C55.5]